MIVLHTGCQANTYEGLDAELIAGVEAGRGALVVSSDLVDKYKEPQFLKDVTRGAHPLVSTPHTILSKWLLDNRIVDIKATGLVDAVTATESKAVDAAFICLPYPSILVSSRKRLENVVKWSSKK